MIRFRAMLAALLSWLAPKPTPPELPPAPPAPVAPQPKAEYRVNINAQLRARIKQRADEAVARAFAASGPKVEATAWERVPTPKLLEGLVVQLGEQTVQLSGSEFVPQPSPIGPDVSTYPEVVPDTQGTTPTAWRSAQTLGTWLGVGQRLFQGLPVVVSYQDSGEPIGTQGLPWQMGYLYLEQNPELTPVLARGQWGNPGEYWQIRHTPPITDRLSEILDPLMASPWRIEPPQAPDATGDVLLDEIRKRRWAQQVAYQRALWHRWTQPGQSYGVRDWVQDIIQFSCVCGFYLGEVHWRHGQPQIPAMRAPWTVLQWVLQGETPIGVVQGLQQTDAFGNVPAVRVLIPWARLVHLAYRAAGPTDLEGTALLRAPYPYAKAYQELHQLQMVSAALNAAGAWIVSQDKDSDVTQEQVDDILDHLATYEATHMPSMVLPRGMRAELAAPGDGIVADLTPQINLMERAIARGMSAGHAPIAVQASGSYAARESASADSRDSLDAYAGLVCTVIERTLRRYLEHAFGGELYVCTAAYGQVEERDQNKYIDTLSKYFSFRDRLPPAAQAVVDKLLDLPTQGADTGAQADAASPPSASLAESYEVPQGVQETAKRALGWIERGFAGDGFTDVGRARAAQLARGGPVSAETLERMDSFFDRFEDQRAEQWDLRDGEPTPWRTAWDAWGGDEGRRWVRRVLRGMD